MARPALAIADSTDHPCRATKHSAADNPSGASRVAAAACPHQRLRALLSLHFDFVWRSLRRLGVLEADVDDAAQQVFVVASRKLDRIESGREKGFLFATAIRVAADARRARRRRREVDEPCAIECSSGIPGPDDQLDERWARACLDQILASMPIDLSAVFVLFEIEELPSAQIADMMGLPVGTVASRLRRARQDFQQRAVRMRARLGLEVKST